MKNNPLLKLESFGQSIWLDYLRRGLITSGELKQLIDEDGLSGVTSNPSIFEKAIAGSHDYDEAIRTLALADKSVDEMYQTLTVEDIQQAADLLRPIYDRLDGRDGFVSLEVSPHLARDTEGTIAEAHRLWEAVNRPNVLIKVPATQEGLPAIQQLISAGINVNITLLFGLLRYQKVAEAYMAGLEARLAQGQSVDRVASVASFFLSRIDVLVDPLLEEKMKSLQTRLAECLHGQVAIASAKTAYQIYREIFNSERFRKLAEAGARPQRLLWASTSTKNPAYSDIKYVETLVGPDTVNTLPQETLNAYREHGRPELRLEEGFERAQDMLRDLSQLGIDLEAVIQQLEREGIDKFNKSFDHLMQTLHQERQATLAEPVDRQSFNLGAYEAVVQKRLARLAHHGRDKVTFLVPEAIATLGMWLEQLLAESTGKDGTGLLPVAGEAIGEPSVYGDDRLFIYFRLKDEIDQTLEHGIDRLQGAGHPVVTIQLDNPLDLGQEFFRWEMAVAVAGAILDINPFDQPNVQESKDNTNRLLARLKTEGQLPDEEPVLVEDSLQLFAQDAAPTLEETLERFLSWAHRSEFVTLMAYLTESSSTTQALEAIRLHLRVKLHVATTLGYGPRFLHSTGQFHKGGSNIGLFLQLTMDDDVDAHIPGESYTFSVFRQAQTLGDLKALRWHSRRVIRIHLSGDVGEGLARLHQALEVALTEAAEVALVGS